MTREEEIKEAAVAFCKKEAPNGLAFITQSSFVVGALWADAHPHWISVEDELPPKVNDYDDVSITVLMTDGNRVYKGLYMSTEDLNGWFSSDLWALDNITHWMPLPQLPKKGK